MELFADEGGQGLERMHSILLTYSFYNFDLSYCQACVCVYICMYMYMYECMHSILRTKKA